MTLRCKPGDLAVIIKSSAGNEGKVVTCLRLASFEEIRFAQTDHHLGPQWVVDRILPAVLFPINVIRDDRLRSLRDTPGQDETLTLAGLPSPVSTKEHA